MLSRSLFSQIAEFYGFTFFLLLLFTLFLLLLSSSPHPSVSVSVSVSVSFSFKDKVFSHSVIQIGLENSCVHTGEPL